MAEENKNPYGYDLIDEVPTGGSRYLSFKKGDKDRVIQIKLVSEPKYLIQHWILGSDGRQSPVECQGDKCSRCGDSVPSGDKIQKTPLWGWIVVDREDDSVKLFTGPTLIARDIREETKRVDIKTEKITWLNPLLYDFQITRTEEPGGSYYKVKCMIETKGKLTKKEEKAVEEVNINLEEELKGGKKSENIGNYGDMENKPKKEVKPKEEEQISSDDLPF